MVNRYYSHQNSCKVTTKGMNTWLSTTILINLLFALFPVAVTVTQVAFIGSNVQAFWSLSTRGRKVLSSLLEASVFWKQLQLETSEDGRMQLEYRIIEANADLEAMMEEIKPHVWGWIYHFRLSNCINLMFTCICFFVFCYLLYTLLHSYRPSGTQTSQSSTRSHPGKDSSHSSKQNGYRIFRPGIRHLALVALGVVIAMISNIIISLLGIFMAPEMVLDRKWRSVYIWLTTGSDCWSAIPIAWQCWKLFATQTPRPVETLPRANALPPAPEKTFQSKLPLKGSSVELEVKLCNSL